MKISLKKYNIIKTKKSLKNCKLIFFLTGVNKLSINWIITEQQIKNFKFCYYKLLTNTAKTVITNSVYLNLFPAINSITFIFKLLDNLYEIKKNYFFNLEPLQFFLFSIKLNNKLYSRTDLNNILSLNYNNNKLLLYQFFSTNLKIFLTKK